jgi:hypothetical protein
VLLGYVSVGSGGAGGAWLLISLGLLAIGVVRARREPAQAAIVSKILSRALTLLPGALVVYLSFHAGGFLPEPQGRVGVLLALILAARLALRPGVGGAGRFGAGLAIAFVAYIGWVLASGGWSGASERALTSADLAVEYGLGFVLFATSTRGVGDMRWVMRGIALGSFFVCVAAFLSRAVPTVWSSPAGFDTPRLSYPLTYWNALGLLAALGIVLCVGLTCDDREPRLAKTLSAAAIPLLSVTLLLTFSRGPIAACGAGLIVYLLIARPRSLLTAAIAAGPATFVALGAAYAATSLAQVVSGSAAQASEGHHVAAVTAACMVVSMTARWVLAGLDPRLLRIGTSRPRFRPSVVRGLWVGAFTLAVIGALILGAPHALNREYAMFVKGNVEPGHAQLRERLTDIGADGRITLWRIALHEFDSAPLAGTGAGTYVIAFDAQRSATGGQVLNAHSLYFENLGELGIVGIGLLGAVVLGVLVAISGRVRQPDRTLYAAAFAAILVWAIHAGFDWDWQMPAVTLPAFVLAGAGLGRSSMQTSSRQPLLALCAVVAGMVPALISVSQTHLDAAATAFAQNDCAAATRDANASLTPLGFRHGAREILAYCDLARGNRAAATSEMADAVRDDPNNWEPRYGLAVVMAASGRNPRPDIRAAKALNPFEPVTDALATKLLKDGPSLWPDDGLAAPLPIDGQYGGALVAMQATARGGNIR